MVESDAKNVENVCATSGYIQPAALGGHASTGGLSVLPLLVTLSSRLSQTNLFHVQEDLWFGVDLLGLGVKAGQSSEGKCGIY